MRPLIPKPPAQAAHDLVGIDLNDEFLKIVHVKSSRMKREVAHLAAKEIRGMTEEDVSAQIQKKLFSWGLKNPRAFVTVPMHTVVIRSIEIPSLNPDEIREIVNLQASRHTPYSRSDIIIDTLDLGVVRDNYTKVLLIIAPREAVLKQQRILERAGLRIEKVFFPPEGMAHACCDILHKESQSSPLAVVHMDSEFTNFIVIQSRRVYFVRGIAVGARNLLEERAAYGDRFVDELQKSLESYTSDEAGPPPSLLVLTGVAAETESLDSLFTETLKMPIKHQTYFKYFAISKEALEVAESTKNLSFFNVIAPLLVWEKMKVDMVTEERRLKIQLEKRAREVLTTGVLAMVFLALVSGVLAGKIYFKRVYYEKLHARYEPVIRDAKELDHLFSKTQIIKDYLANRGASIEALTELYGALPKEIYLANVRYEDAKQFTVKGTSKTMAAVFTFVTNMEKSERFASVKTKYVTSRSENGVDQADFEIVSEIEGGGL